MNRKSVIVSALTLAAFAVTTAAAQIVPSPSEVKDSRKAQTAPEPANAPVKAPVAAQGVVVFKDPETGAIRQPSASEIGDLLTAAPGGTSARPSSSQPASAQAIAVLPAPSQSVAIEGLPGGMRGMRLGTDTMVNTVVTKTPDGRLVMGEVIGDKAAAGTVTNGSKPAAAGPVKEDRNDR